MAFQKVSAGSGLSWLTDAVKLILKNPTAFALMGLVAGCIAAIPLLGMAMAIIGPALYGGIMYAAREQDAGRPADFQHLFQAFREEGKIGKMIMLCLPTIAAAIVLGILIFIFVGGALLSAGAAASANNSGAALGAGLGIGMLLVVIVGIAIGLVVFALTFFATPRVMLEGADPIPAMKESLQACLANIGPILVYLVIMIGLSIAASIVISLPMLLLFFIPLLPQFLSTVVLMTLLLPLMSVASYMAWRQVCQPGSAAELPPSAPSSASV